MTRAGFIQAVACFGLCLVSFAAARPDGAPVSACESMRPSHGSIPPQAEPVPYNITANASTFINGQPVTVRIEGPDYQGVLLQARENGSTKPLGSWINPPPNTRILKCDNNTRAAVTHSNTIPKTRNTTYTWMPPDSDCPDAIIFVATAAETFTRFFVNIKSAALQKDPAATCNTTSNWTTTTTSNWTTTTTSNWTTTTTSNWTTTTTSNWTTTTTSNWTTTTTSNWTTTTTSNWTTTTSNWTTTTMSPGIATSSASTETLSTWISSLFLLLAGHLFIVLDNLC